MKQAPEAVPSDLGVGFAYFRGLGTYRQRLLNVARALEESPRPHRFRMTSYTDGDCGSPACALGHYAARMDLQEEFCLWSPSFFHPERDPVTERTVVANGFNCTSVSRHFGISPEEALNLFGAHGCDTAETPAQAIDYIERFVARRYPRAA